MTRVSVSPQVLRWALRRSGRPEAVERRFPELKNWLSRTKNPTMKQLEQFSKATAAPLGYFFLPEPPEERLPIPYFRTLDREPEMFSVDLLETIQEMRRRQAWMREYLMEEEKQGPLPFVGSANSSQDPVAIAKDIRRVLGVDGGWAADAHSWQDALRVLEVRAEAVGVSVAVSGTVGNNTHRPLRPEEFRGFALADDYAPLVFLNNADTKAAQIFTLAHELAHIWIGASAAFDLRQLQSAASSAEQICDRIAAEFLVPEAELREYWPTTAGSPQRFADVARRFRVSEIVAARRALDLQLIGRGEFFDFYNQYEKTWNANSSKRSSRGGDFYERQKLRLGRRFAEMVDHAVSSGALLYLEAYRLTGLYGETYSRTMVRMHEESAMA